MVFPALQEALVLADLISADTCLYPSTMRFPHVLYTVRMCSGLALITC